MHATPSQPDSTIVGFRASLFGILRLWTIHARERDTSSDVHVEESVPCSALSGARTLLAYLLLHRQQPHARVVLAGRLWPEVTDARARRSLSQAIWRINRCLPGLLQTDPDTIGISPQAQLWTDVAEFTALLHPYLTDAADRNGSQTANSVQARADIYRAVRLYRGDLLEGLYADWVLAERDRLWEMYLSALERAIQLEKREGCYDQALIVAQTLVDADPLRESAHREIMRLHSLLDRPEAALRQFDACRQILAAELDVEPETETIQLAREIANRAGRAIVPYLPAGSPPVVFLDNPNFDKLPLVGRKSERAELVALLEATCKGSVGFVLVEGEAGVGKTRLLQEIARDAEWRGAQVLWGKGKEMEAAGPYEPLLEALNSGLSPLRAGQIVGLLREAWKSVAPEQSETIWLHVLSPLLPALSGSTPDARSDAQTFRPVPLEPAQEHMRLVEALSHLLSAWGRITPLILILEDLHWADRDTLDMLIHLAEQLPAWSDYAPRPGATRDRPPGGILVIGSFRGEEARAHPDVWNRLCSLDRLGLHGRLVLQRLDATATSELIHRSLGTGQPFPLFEARLYRETDGNPLFVLETLRCLYGEKLLQYDKDRGWSTPFDETTTDYAELPLSPVIEDVIAQRLTRLPSDLRPVLNAAAVLGNLFDFATVTTVAGGMDTSTVLTALSDLARRGFVEETDREYRFHHDKIRLVVYESLSVKERTRLHCRVARTIEAKYPDRVELLAHHWTHGQVWDKAVHYHQLAAENAQHAHAYAMAVKHLDAAIQLLDRADVEGRRYDLLAAREAALAVLGEWEAQAADLEAMWQLAHGDALRQAHIQCRRAEMLTYLSRHDEAETAAREALALAERCGCKSAQAAALMILGLVVSRGRPGQTISYLRQAVELCQEETDLPQKAQAHCALATTLSYYERYSEAQTEAELSLALYEQLQDKRGQAQALGALGIICMEQGALETASSCYFRALQLAREMGCRYMEASTLGNLAEMFWMKGQLARSLQYTAEAQRIFRALGDRLQETLARMNAAYRRHYLLGDDNTAWADLQAGLASYIKVGDSARYEFLGTLGDIARCRGDLKTARAILESAVSGALVDAEDEGAAGLAYIHLVQLALDEGDPETALQHLEKAEAIYREAGPASRIVKLLSLRGLVLLALGQNQAALAATSEAMSRLKPGLEQAYLVPYHHAQVLSALGRTQEARAALDQAYHMLSEILGELPPQEQKMGWERVPEHRALLATWQAAHPPRATVRLPRADAPTGRPLRNDEYVEVRWTLTAPEDAALPDKVTCRHKRLLRLLHEAEEQGAAPTVDDLAAALDVSQATIKRDLAALRRSGHQANTRGHHANK